MNKLPEGAIPGENFVTKDIQCDTCTHYKKEHIEALEGHCTHLMYVVPQDDLPPGSITPQCYCNCQKFEDGT